MKYEVRTADIAGSPCKPTPRSEGCGQCVELDGKWYYYRSPYFIPKDKPALLTWEGNYCSRQNGDKEHLIVAFNGKNFTVLQHVYPGGVKEAMAKYKGLTNEEAVALKHKEMEKAQKEYDAMPKCKCGRIILIFEEDQRKDECVACFEKRTKKKKKKRG